jgi:hypothetical protein
MATTTNYGWTTPDNTDLVKDGASAIRSLGSAIDTSLGGAWTSYTPTLKTGSDIKTTTISYAKYKQINKTLFVQVRLTATQAGTASARINISLPTGFTYQNVSANASVGSFLILDFGSAFYSGTAVLILNIENIPSIYGTAYNSIDNMGTSAPTITIANNDVISFTVTCEVA